MEMMLCILKEKLARAEEYTINPDAFDNEAAIATRVQELDQKVADSLSKVLRYLYITKGPLSLSKKQFDPSVKLLSEAEYIIVKYLKSRTNGSGRRRYGKPALRAARKARYRCEACGNADVRVLVLDHANGRNDVENFFMLCANCHQIKSRIFDWSGKKREETESVES